MTFTLDGTPLTSDYDEVEDILYLWVDGPQPAVTFETGDGHLVHLDPERREVVGVTIVDYRRRWEGRGELTLDVPVVRQHVLQPA